MHRTNAIESGTNSFWKWTRSMCVCVRECSNLKADSALSDSQYLFANVGSTANGSQHECWLHLQLLAANFYFQVENELWNDEGHRKSLRCTAKQTTTHSVGTQTHRSNERWKYLKQMRNKYNWSKRKLFAMRWTVLIYRLNFLGNSVRQFCFVWATFILSSTHWMSWNFVWSISPRMSTLNWIERIFVAAATCYIFFEFRATNNFISSSSRDAFHKVIVKSFGD